MRSLVVWLTVATSTAFGAAFTENFDSLPGVPPNNWTVVNLSVPVGDTPWFQGKGLIFPSHQGAADSYAATTFESAELGGVVDTWLISPLMHIDAGDVVSFYTRTKTGTPYLNTLELWLSPDGGDDVGDFTSLMLSISGTGDDGYPDEWTQFSQVFMTAYPNARFAFRHTINRSSEEGDYIGVDTFEVASSPAEIPEPGTLTLLGCGLLAMARARRRNLRA